MSLHKPNYFTLKRLRIGLVCIFAVLIVITVCLLGVKKSHVYIRYVSKILRNRKLFYNKNEYSNGLTKNNLGFHMRQHENYWILYNYIVAQKKFKGNESITLVTHGEWTSIMNFTKTLTRWKGPISLTLFSNGRDFQRTRDILNYIKFCSKSWKDFNNYVTINIIMHRSFIPKLIPRTEKQFFESNVKCSLYNFDYSDNFRIQQNLKYPSNLARNVGRLTALTEYIFTVDMEFIPSPNVPKLFLNVIKKLHLKNRKKSVFVIPSVDLQNITQLPVYQSDFLKLDQKYIEKYLTSTCVYKVPNIRQWLYTDDNKITITEYGQRFGTWWGFYISINMYEPFYDETHDKESKLDKSSHMDLLEFLGYEFYFLKNAFLVRYINDTYNYEDEMPPLNTSQQIVDNQRSVCVYKEILVNFIF